MKKKATIYCEPFEIELKQLATRTTKTEQNKEQIRKKPCQKLTENFFVSLIFQFGFPNALEIDLIALQLVN
jgi:hypothetical protein